MTPRSSAASKLTNNLFHLKEIIQGKRLVGDKKIKRRDTIRRPAKPRNSMFQVTEAYEKRDEFVVANRRVLSNWGGKGHQTDCVLVRSKKNTVQSNKSIE